MSPLPLARRCSSTQPALQPTLLITANLLDAAYHRDVGRTISVTVTVTETEWYSTPQPTSRVAGYSMSGRSRDAIIPPTTELPTIGRPTSERFASPTSSPTSGASSGTMFRTGLVAGAVSGVLMVIAAAVVYIIWRRRRYVRVALRIGKHGCRSERPSIESTPSRGARDSTWGITPYDLHTGNDVSEDPPPSYDTLAECETYVVPPEPALVRKATPRQQSTYSRRDESRSPSTGTGC
ncbi:hypothetical protein LXA43DRAFT_371482 [Ganoderma leucocontextum]|nr:hypothetical protein LXA43DRAFT_371482 [Ganoderma leucocontextum]